MHGIRKILLIFFFGVILIPQFSYASVSVKEIIAKLHKTENTCSLKNYSEHHTPYSSDNAQQNDESHCSLNFFEYDWYWEDYELHLQRPEYKIPERNFYYIDHPLLDSPKKPWLPPKIVKL